MVLLFCSVAVLFTGFAFYRIREEARALGDDIQRQALQLAESRRSSVERSLVDESYADLQVMADRFGGHGRLLGMAIYDSAGRLLAMTSGLVSNLTSTPVAVHGAIRTQSGREAYFRSQGKRMHVFALPLSRDGQALGAISVFHDVAFIARPAWRHALGNLWQTLLVFACALLIVGWSLSRPPGPPGGRRRRGWYASRSVLRRRGEPRAG